MTERRDKATKNLIFNLRESFYIQLKRTGLQDNLTFNQGTDLWLLGGGGGGGGGGGDRFFGGGGGGGGVGGGGLGTII